ncbi:Biotin carboxyl carrier protein of acetyl-coa carboxylase, partial [human gut metagenome]
SYIKSNLAGTFYLRKEENAEPFVKLNEKINENNNLNDLRKDLDKEKEINSEFASDIKNIEIKMEEILKYLK